MNWNAACYQQQYSYVWQHGESLLTMLNAQPEETILDLGCGTGQLTEQIATCGADVTGLDSDPAMVAQAQANYADIAFRIADAASFGVAQPVDAVFSNAALHWVPDVRAAANCIAQAIKPGGRFVAELGGKGNVQTIIAALEAVSGRSHLNPWYFPSLGEYAALLEQAGFEVVFAQLFDRPTNLGEAGLAGWLEMFSQRFFADVPAAEWSGIVKEVEKVASELYQDNTWMADYRRLRVVGIRQ